MTNERDARMFLKHSMSCLQDLPIEATIDDDRKEVRITLRSFDSVLVGIYVTQVLPTQYDVVAFRDDAAVSEGSWLPKPAAYSLSIDLAGVRYRAHVVKLFSLPGQHAPDVSVTLHPIPLGAR